MTTLYARIREALDRIREGNDYRDSSMCQCAFRDALNAIEPLLPPANICPSCEASGSAIGLIAGQMHVTDCPKCGGLGMVSLAETERMRLGEVLRQERLLMRMPLRKAAELLGVSPTTFSMAEQGDCTADDILELTDKLQRWASRRSGKEPKHGAVHAAPESE